MTINMCQYLQVFLCHMTGLDWAQKISCSCAIQTIIFAVDEYLTSVVVANFKTGTVAARHVPKKLGPVLLAANHDILADVLDVYTYRRKTRVF